MAVGYRDADDYSDSLWMETGSQLYRVYRRVSAYHARQLSLPASSACGTTSR